VPQVPVRLATPSHTCCDRPQWYRPPVHEVGVLRRRRAAGTTAAGRACVWRASAVATRSGAAGHDRNNRGSQVLIAAISGRVMAQRWRLKSDS
jgi:hypothetical protein